MHIHIGDSKEKVKLGNSPNFEFTPLPPYRSIGKEWKPYWLKVIEHNLSPITDWPISYAETEATTRKPDLQEYFKKKTDISLAAYHRGEKLLNKETNF